MVLNWSLATKEQLIQIALTEDCPIDYKYKAAAELQERRYQPKTDDSICKIISFFGQGFLISEIAQRIGLSDYKVQLIVEKYGLWKPRLFNELRRTDASNKGTIYPYYNGKRV